MNLDDFKKLSCAQTHAGNFHADDVFATALLKLINRDMEIIRTFQVDPAVFHYDIGGGAFDHHQADYQPKREDGTPYSSFGLLWAAVGRDILGEEGFEYIDRELVEPIDLTDCTGARNPLSGAISAMNPAWDSGKSLDEAFWEAVSYAQRTLRAYIDDELAALRADDLVRTALKANQNGLVILPRYAPFKHVLSSAPDALLVGFPSNRGGFNLMTVTHESGEDVQLPETWVTDGKPQGCSFCHVGRFLAAFDTLDNLKAAASAFLDSLSRSEQNIGTGTILSGRRPGDGNTPGILGAGGGESNQ